eukprot:13592.XXX_273416_273535_1 [CDS] Oithona nana genome sequencing.
MDFIFVFDFKGTDVILIVNKLDIFLTHQISPNGKIGKIS